MRSQDVCMGSAVAMTVANWSRQTVIHEQTLLQLYVIYIRPLLEYAVPVWDPHNASNSRVVENVQKFSLRMCWMLVMTP